MVELYWLHERLGGDTTLASYGVEVMGHRRETDVHCDALAAVPQSHVDFLGSLQLTHQHEGLLFVHAGIKPGVAIADQDVEDLLWIRKEFHSHSASHPLLIVHGHTPVGEATHYGNRVNLDTGAGYGNPLTAAVFEDGRAWTLGAQGRTALGPLATFGS